MALPPLQIDARSRATWQDYPNAVAHLEQLIFDVSNADDDVGGEVVMQSGFGVSGAAVVPTLAHLLSLLGR